MENRALFLIIIIFFISSCTLSKKEGEKFVETKDHFTKGVYLNDELGLEIKFDSDWIVLLSYNDFNSDQRELSSYFNSENDELLFIGFNEKDSIGVKCTNQILGLQNQDYLDRLKKSNSDYFTKYHYEEVSSEEKVYSKIEGIRLISKIKLNKNNIFVFDSLIFKNRINNIKLDFWMSQDVFKEKKNYIENIFESINFK